MSNTPEIIYLMPSDDGLVWCDDPAPDEHCDPAEAVRYVRADVHQAIIGRQAKAALMDINTAKESKREDNARLTQELEQAQARVVELEAESAHLADDEAMRFDQVVYLVRALRQSSRGKEIIEQAAGAQAMDNDLRDYLEDVGMLQVSAERQPGKAEKAGGEQ